MPILYSFRRCPYAMRARLALQSAQIRCEVREVVLRDKPPELLLVSPKATVPVLVVGERVIDESLDIMRWALEQHDPQGWLQSSPDNEARLAHFERDFKRHLDAYKYGAQPAQALTSRGLAGGYLMALETRLGAGHLGGQRPSWVDMAMLPFIRQFASVDRPWFDAQAWPQVRGWLERFLKSQEFKGIMAKHRRWQAGDPVALFP